MQTKIRSTNFEMTPAIEEYAEKKISSLAKFLYKENESLCEIELGKTTQHHKSGEVFRAEIHITSPGKNDVYAVAEETDLYAAIDVVRDEAERAIVSDKKKRFTLLRRGAAKLKSLLKRENH